MIAKTLTLQEALTRLRRYADAFRAGAGGCGGGSAEATAICQAVDLVTEHRAEDPGLKLAMAILRRHADGLEAGAGGCGGYSEEAMVICRAVDIIEAALAGKASA